MAQFLMIENSGVADPASFTLIGASAKSNSSNRNVIGTFGSGCKYSIALTLRHGVAPTIYVGTLRMNFTTKSTKVNGTNFDQVVVKYGGKDDSGKSCSKTEDLGYVMSYGANDWKEVSMALREFVSNAIDGAIAYDPENYLKHVNIKIVDEENVRAKSGTTRVFVPLNNDVYSFYHQLDKWFLHFRDPSLLNQAILPKNNSIDGSGNPVIYKKGVRVREVSYITDSLFDYNLSDLQLDESRKADDYTAAHYAAIALARADKATLIKMFEGLQTRNKAWEQTFSHYSLSVGLGVNERDRWLDAFNSLYGDKAVIATSGNGEMAARKGYNVIHLGEQYVEAAKQANLPTPESVLDYNDLKGRVVYEPTKEAQTAVDFAWDIIKLCEYTNGKEKPIVKSFSQTHHADSCLFGYHKGGIVYMNKDYAGDSDTPANKLTNQVISTAIEECLHYSTGCADFSREMQTALFDMITRLVR